MRRLAPAGGFPPIQQVRRSLTSADLAGETRRALLRLFHLSEIALCSSGKAALESICRHLASEGKKQLLVAGYSCPDIVAAAVKGGLRVSPLDINPETLEIETGMADHQEKTDVVLLSNLYGLIDPAGWLEHTRWIDDACQAALSLDQGKRVGSRAVGLISFGRGKAICGIGGGAVLGLSDAETVAAGSTAGLLKSAAFSLLERPDLYWIPASLPFLHLGETVYDPEFASTAASRGQLAVAYSQIERLEETRQILAAAAERWTKALEDLPVVLPSKLRERNAGGVPCLIRFPVIFPDETVRDRAYRRLSEAGLGASLSYPASLGTLCERETRFTPRPTPAAEQAARRIITLPVHRYVEPRDFERARKIVKELC